MSLIEKVRSNAVDRELEIRKSYVRTIAEHAAGRIPESDAARDIASMAANLPGHDADRIDGEVQVAKELWDLIGQVAATAGYETEHAAVVKSWGERDKALKTQLKEIEGLIDENWMKKNNSQGRASDINRKRGRLRFLLQNNREIFDAVAAILEPSLVSIAQQLVTPRVCPPPAEAPYVSREERISQENPSWSEAQVRENLRNGHRPHVPIIEPTPQPRTPEPTPEALEEEPAPIDPPVLAPEPVAAERETSKRRSRQK
ncbi:MAG TPA: hypothetical protein VH370_08000 [Humisphaera sp.]|jgi:hypothetical protein|nr:hypothetical protein [Humisphaera sp.]